MKCDLEKVASSREVLWSSWKLAKPGLELGCDAVVTASHLHGNNTLVLSALQDCLLSKLQQDVWLTLTRTAVDLAQSPDSLWGWGECDPQEPLQETKGPLTLRGSWGGKLGP